MAVFYRNPHEQSRTVAQEEVSALQSERKDLAQRMAWIDARIQQLEAFLIAITPLIENDPGRVAAEAGLTNFCRDFLDKNPRWMSAGEIRVLLAGVGIDISTYTNPMAVLHSVLKRVGQMYRDPTTGNLFYGSNNIPFPLESPERHEYTLQELVKPANPPAGKNASAVAARQTERAAPDPEYKHI